MYLKSKWYRLLATLIVSCVCFVGFSFSQPTNSQNTPVSSGNMYPTEVASTMWANGFFPVENFQSYSSPFGYRRHPVTGEVQFHNGLDLAAPLGSYVRSWWNGKIVKVSQDSFCGTYVTIKSGTWEHVYCHLKGSVDTSGQSPVLVDRGGGLQLAQGQEISAGTRIGRVGMTGRTTGPHLHWVLRHNGDYIDPALIIKEMFRQKAHLMPKSNDSV